MAIDSVNYREWHVSDCHGLHGLVRQMIGEAHAGVPEHLLQLLTRRYLERTPPCTFVNVAELTGELIGFTTGEMHGNLPIVRLREHAIAGYLGELYVLPAYRGRGIAKRLLNGMMGRLWDAGANTVWGEPTNAFVRRLYRRCGAEDMPAMSVTREAYKPL